MDPNQLMSIMSQIGEAYHGITGQHPESQGRQPLGGPPDIQQRVLQESGQDPGQHMPPAVTPPNYGGTGQFTGGGLLPPRPPRQAGFEGVQATVNQAFGGGGGPLPPPNTALAGPPAPPTANMGGPEAIRRRVLQESGQDPGQHMPPAVTGTAPAQQYPLSPGPSNIAETPVTTSQALLQAFGAGPPPPPPAVPVQGRHPGGFEPITTPPGATELGHVGDPASVAATFTAPFDHMPPAVTPSQGGKFEPIPPGRYDPNKRPSYRGEGSGGYSSVGTPGERDPFINIPGSVQPIVGGQGMPRTLPPNHPYFDVELPAAAFEGRGPETAATFMSQFGRQDPAAIVGDWSSPAPPVPPTVQPSATPDPTRPTDPLYPDRQFPAASEPTDPLYPDRQFPAASEPTDTLYPDRQFPDVQGDQLPGTMDPQEPVPFPWQMIPGVNEAGRAISGGLRAAEDKFRLRGVGQEEGLPYHFGDPAEKARQETRMDALKDAAKVDDIDTRNYLIRRANQQYFNPTESTDPIRPDMGEAQPGSPHLPPGGESLEGKGPLTPLEPGDPGFGSPVTLPPAVDGVIPLEPGDPGFVMPESKEQDGKGIRPIVVGPDATGAPPDTERIAETDPAAPPKTEAQKISETQRNYNQLKQTVEHNIGRSIKARAANSKDLQAGKLKIANPFAGGELIAELSLADKGMKDSLNEGGWGLGPKTKEEYENWIRIKGGGTVVPDDAKRGFWLGKLMNQIRGVYKDAPNGSPRNDYIDSIIGRWARRFDWGYKGAGAEEEKAWLRGILGQYYRGGQLDHKDNPAARWTGYDGEGPGVGKSKDKVIFQRFADYADDKDIDNKEWKKRHTTSSYSEIGGFSTRHTNLPTFKEIPASQGQRTFGRTGVPIYEQPEGKFGNPRSKESIDRLLSGAEGRQGQFGIRMGEGGVPREGGRRHPDARPGIENAWMRWIRNSSAANRNSEVKVTSLAEMAEIWVNHYDKNRKPGDPLSWQSEGLRKEMDRLIKDGIITANASARHHGGYAIVLDGIDIEDDLAKANKIFDAEVTPGESAINSIHDDPADREALPPGVTEIGGKIYSQEEREYDPQASVTGEGLDDRLIEAQLGEGVGADRKVLKPGDEGFIPGPQGAEGMGVPETPVLSNALKKAGIPTRVADPQMVEKIEAKGRQDEKKKQQTVREKALKDYASVQRRVKQAEADWDAESGDINPTTGAVYTDNEKRVMKATRLSDGANKLMLNLLSEQVNASNEALKSTEMLLEFGRGMSEAFVKMGDSMTRMAGGLRGQQGPTSVPTAIMTAINAVGSKKAAAIERLSIFGMTGHLFPGGSSVESMRAQLPMLKHTQTLQQQTKEFAMGLERDNLNTWLDYLSSNYGHQLTAERQNDLRSQFDRTHAFDREKSAWDHALERWKAHDAAKGALMLDRLELETIAALDQTIDMGKQVLNEKYKHNTGFFKNWWETIGNYTGHGSPEWHAFKQLTTYQLNTYVNNLTGKQLSKHEVARLKGVVPQMSDDDAIFTRKAKTFIALQQRMRARKLRVYALNGHDVSRFMADTQLSWKQDGVIKSGTAKAFHNMVAAQPNLVGSGRIVMLDDFNRPIYKGQDYLGDVMNPQGGVYDPTTGKGSYIDYNTGKYVGPEIDMARGGNIGLGAPIARRFAPSAQYKTEEDLRQAAAPLWKQIMKGAAPTGGRVRLP